MTQIADLTDRLNRLAKRREDEGIYTDAMIASAAADRIAALEAQLAERVKELRTARGIISNTHKRPVKHAGCVNPYCPICEGGLFVCADCGAAEIETEQRVCTGPALEATPPAPKVTEARTWGEIPNTRTDDAPPINVLAGILLCAESWVPEARIIGDVRAGDIARAIRAFEPSALATLTAAQEAGKP